MKETTPILRSLSEVRVGVVGGGLAGMAAALALGEAGAGVELFESKRQLGGRAGSFQDAATGEWVDHCQHVSMGCCTNYVDFCRRTGTSDLLRRDTELSFYSPAGRRHAMAGSPWLPAPLHLAPALFRQSYLSLADRARITRTLLRLARMTPDQSLDQISIGQWLRQRGQTEQVIRRFWSVVLVSALSETVERASLAAARKVFVDGFMASPAAYHVLVPTVPLAELYERAAAALADQNVVVHLEQSVSELCGTSRQITGVKLADGTQRSCDFVILAVPWRQLRQLIPRQLEATLKYLESAEQLASSSITAVHIWLDRTINAQPHAVLVDRLTQWVFHRGLVTVPGKPGQKAHHYQIVISASGDLDGRDRRAVMQEVLDDLQAVWPVAGDARVIQWRVITQRHAVFSVVPGSESCRPSQQTDIPNLLLAGDWTATGWPATMEGAVRSGYLAAEEVMQATGNVTRFVAPDLPRGWLARRLLAEAGEQSVVPK